MTLTAILIVLFGHWFADFVLQNRYMAENKSRDWMALSLHVAVYTLALGPFVVWVLPPDFMLIWGYLAINGAAHFVTDAVTSRITTRLWKAGRTHNFFAVVGFDQFIHHATLLGTLYWLA